MTKNKWMVRAGEGAFLIDEFREQARVSIGWEPMGDVSTLQSREQFAARVAQVYPAFTPAQRDVDQPSVSFL
jgi:restriction system protein